MGIRKHVLIYGAGGWHRLVRSRSSCNRHLLIIQLSGFGDACTLIPHVRQLAANGYLIDVAAQAGLEDLWRHFVPVKHYFPLSGFTGRSPVSTSDQRRLDQCRYEAVFSTSLSPPGAYLASLPITGQRIGMAGSGKKAAGAFLFTRLYKAGSDEHVSSRFLNLFRTVLKLTDESENPKCAPRAHGPVLIHPGAKWKPRRWPAERYWETARRLAAAQIPVTILVHDSEPDLKDYFKQCPETSGIVIREIHTLKMLIDFTERAHLFIGNDSGPVHLANLCEIPTVVLWGPGEFDRIRPLGKNNLILIKPIDCRPCTQYNDPDYCIRGVNECLLKISADEAVQAALWQLRPH